MRRLGSVVEWLCLVRLLVMFHGVPAEERLHWRSFLVKLGADNLEGAKNEELLVASHKSVYIVYTMLGDVCLFVVGKDEYDELALKDVCGKPPTERLFLDKYGRICLCLDEIVWKGLLENTEKDRVRRLIRLKPPTERVSKTRIVHTAEDRGMGGNDGFLQDRNLLGKISKNG
ncbi:hypothetical protein EJ110_NYTH34233 [Nymphaea thermarum]|nr:hypothetical protein EJ110_NYTH34233 [Nymphaea thermarum]